MSSMRIFTCALAAANVSSWGLRLLHRAALCGLPTHRFRLRSRTRRYLRQVRRHWYFLLPMLVQHLQCQRASGL